MEEIEANTDLLRAEFAMSTCRVEKSLEQLKRKSADQLVELGKRADVINRLKIDRGTLKVELAETNALLEALKADKNSLRAEFAISTCRVEKSLEQLKRKSTDQVGRGRHVARARTALFLGGGLLLLVLGFLIAQHVAES
jgi:hypothetical protein